MVKPSEVVASRSDKPPPNEPLRAELDALRSLIARLPRQERDEFQPLVEELQGQRQRNTPNPAESRRQLQEIRAIAKCVEFELDIWQSDFAPRHAKDYSEDEPHRRLDCPAIIGPCHRPIGPKWSGADASAEDV